MPQNTDKKKNQANFPFFSAFFGRFSTSVLIGSKFPSFSPISGVRPVFQSLHDCKARSKVGCSKKTQEEMFKKKAEEATKEQQVEIIKQKAIEEEWGDQREGAGGTTRRSEEEAIKKKE